MALRFPARIDSWKIINNSKPHEYDPWVFCELIKKVISELLDKTKRPGILLSGGIDSSILALLANKLYPDIPCITIGKNKDHPDVIASMKLSQEKNLNHFIYFPSQMEIVNIQKELDTHYAGDEGVALALRFASKLCTDLLATDGIDEQMGGYWGHRDRISFPETNEAFIHFWNQLEPNHLTPMHKSAERENININWVFLHQKIVDFISRIPLDVRIKDSIRKAYWKIVAEFADTPEWIINRDKVGFVDALNNVSSD